MSDDRFTFGPRRRLSDFDPAKIRCRRDADSITTRWLWFLLHLAVVIACVILFALAEYEGASYG